MQGLRLGRLIIWVPSTYRPSSRRCGPCRNPHANHDDVEQTILDDFRNVGCGKAEPVSDCQPCKGNQKRTPIALQPKPLRLSQNNLDLRLSLGGFRLDEILLDLKLEGIGSVLIIADDIDDVLYLTASGSD